MKALVLLLALTGYTFAQCNLPLLESPTIRDVQLGMSQRSILDTLGKPSGNFTPNSLNYYGSLDKAPALQGVWTLHLAFYKDRAELIQIRYEHDAAPFTDILDFASTLSERWKLPKMAWERSGDAMSMNCGHFLVQLAHGYYPTVELSDLDAKTEKDREAAKARDQRKAAFKP